jgi:hypothetical protein
MFAALIATLGCQEGRTLSPTAASLFIPSPDGLWSGPMTLLGTSGGECVAGVVPTFLPVNDFGTVTVTQGSSNVTATITTESTGLACRYVGTATLDSISMNAVSCDRTGLLVTCANGAARELRLVGSSVTATWNGNVITGRATSTYNVFTAPTGEQDGLGALVAAHSFTATRR